MSRTADAFTHGQQQPGIRNRVVASPRDDARVAVELDGEAKS
jgi:hypothetical protein